MSSLNKGNKEYVKKKKKKKKLSKNCTKTASFCVCKEFSTSCIGK